MSLSRWRSCVGFALAAACLAAPGRSEPAYRGMSYTPWSENVLFSAGSDQSLENMAAIGVNTVALNVWAFQDNETSTQIALDFNRYSASLPSISHAISRIHSLGMQVLLKPNVDLRNGNWRGLIQPSAAWFQSYTNFMNDWATFAENHNVAMLSIGTEYKATEGWTSSWQNVAANVRARFGGEITYSANWDSYDMIQWWGAMDHIGIDAYFPLATSPNPSLSQLRQAWTGHANQIEAWRANRGLTQPVVFAEVGYRSVAGATQQPWNSGLTGPVSLTEQANAYDALLSVMNARSWFDGAFWWNWETNPLAGGTSSIDYTPQNKPAQDVLRQYYGGTGPALPRPILDRRLYSWETGLEGWASSGFPTRPVTVATSSLTATHGQQSLAVTQTGDGFSWNARARLTADGLLAVQQSLAHRPQDYVLQVDVTYRDALVPNAVTWMNTSLAVNDAVGGWSDIHSLAQTSGRTDTTITVEIPLQALTSLRTQSSWVDVILGLNGNWGSGAATVFYDNFRIVNLNPAAPADINQDGLLDASDWLGFMAYHNADLTGFSDGLAFARGDLTGDRRNDFDDFLVFHGTYDRVHGAGAFQEMLLTIPEPATFGHLSCLVAFLAGIARYRRIARPEPVRHSSLCR